MKDLVTLINESNIPKKTKFTLDDLKEGLEYLEDYYDEFPEEKGEYPNWGELNTFSKREFEEALMNGDDDLTVYILDRIWDAYYDTKNKK